MTDTTNVLRDNLDRILTGRQELIELGVLPCPQTDGCAEAVPYPSDEIQAQSLSYLNDELQRSLQAIAERAAHQYELRKQADRARWAMQDEVRRLRATVEWFSRYLPQSPEQDTAEDRLAREVIHYAVTGVEFTMPAPDVAPDVPPPMPSRAFGGFDGASTTEAVYQALGAASVAWYPRPTGVFDSTYAKSIGDALLEHIGLGYEVHGQLVDGEGSDRD